MKSVKVVLEDREKELIRMWINRGDSMNTYLTNILFISHGRSNKRSISACLSSYILNDQDEARKRLPVFHIFDDHIWLPNICSASKS